MNKIVPAFRLLLLLIGLTHCFACSNSETATAETEAVTDTIADPVDSANVKPIKVNQKPEGTNIATDSDLQTAIDNFINDPDLKVAISSISVINTANDELVGGHNPHKSIVPASSIKVLTTGAALATLGKEFKFKTELQHDGSIQNGVLSGNLYIKGYGDPTLGSDQMDEAQNLTTVINKMVQTCVDKGIKEIKGQVIGDASYLPSAVNAPTWPWNDLGNYYASGAWGLNIHENLYYLRFQQTSGLGGTPKIKETSPDIPNLTFINELKSAGRNTGDNAYIYGAPYSFMRFVRGTIPVGGSVFSIKGGIPNPPLFAAMYLEKKLAAKGIKIAQSATTQMDLGKAKGKRSTLYTHQSPSLLAIAKRCNHFSVNLYCESLLRELGKQNGDGSLESGLSFLVNFWKQKGLNTEGFFLEDASGLSSKSNTSSYQLAQALHLVSKDKTLFDSFKKTLAIGGRTGTMKRMFKGSIADGKIFAKSGSMTRVRSYTGYATTRNGQQLAFSIISNNFTCESGTMRKKMEKLMLKICE